MVYRGEKGSFRSVGWTCTHCYIKIWTSFRAWGTLLNVMRQPGWEGSSGRMDTYICVAESLFYPPETITTLLISYTPIQNNMSLKQHNTKACVFNGKDLG